MCLPLSEAQEGMAPRVPGLTSGVMPRGPLGTEWREHVAWGAIPGDLGLPACTTEGRAIALQQSYRPFEAITHVKAGGGQHTSCGVCRCDPTATRPLTQIPSALTGWVSSSALTPRE